MKIEEYERLMPTVTVEGMIFHTPTTQCLWRVQTLNTKEPDTIQWLSAMAPGALLYDVGANVGMYTIYAGVRGVRVIAFEPEAQNYAVLCRNIQLNKLKEVAAFPVALGAEQRLDRLRIGDTNAGGSCNTFGADLDYRGNDFQFPFDQGAVSLPMDSFVARYGAPDHIKIDVDGLEHAVVAGGPQAIAAAKSVLIEIDSTAPAHMALFDLMAQRGFRWDDVQIQTARRKEGPFTGIGNVIFTRAA